MNDLLKTFEPRRITPTKYVRQSVFISKKVKVAKGDVHYQNIATVIEGGKGEESFYIVQYRDDYFPHPAKFVKSTFIENNFKINFMLPTGKEVFDIVDEVLTLWYDYPQYHDQLNPYTFLVATCLAKGVDLIDLGILDL